MEQYKLTRDEEYLKFIYPSLIKGSNWILQKMKETDNDKHPKEVRGLLPTGLSAEHFGANDVYYWDDFWALAGLRDTIWAASLRADKKNVQKFQAAFDRLLTAVNSSLKKMEKDLGQALMPISPNRRMDSAAVGSLVALYPTRLFSPYDQRITNTLRYLEENAFNGNWFFMMLIIRVLVLI
ncbi:MAG: hypothetical protein OMM_06124 [Candidatus Magnetoglobus multicellularis str. Araruama]|uniref:Uncharacterized protein n=1 Tax=Candidatus Magnetoglobus multicellularis str. Araruama TaxID=890399 RepID=A0A1V1NRE4_9BACT|nr:MAG: hypothetical protein OMM_06124 [Candidatus Magnetoglobus multicellularis str. Araruama]